VRAGCEPWCPAPEFAKVHTRSKGPVPPAASSSSAAGDPGLSTGSWATTHLNPAYEVGDSYHTPGSARGEGGTGGRAGRASGFLQPVPFGIEEILRTPVGVHANKQAMDAMAAPGGGVALVVEPTWAHP
jgi:hypothetical protein